MLIKDGCDGIEAEAVDLILIEEPCQVGKKESLHLVLGIVEQHRVPAAVVASLATVREAVVGAVEVLDAVVHVVARVRVNEVDDDTQSHAVRLVDQVLEVVRCARARAHTKEARDMVTKATIVRVLLYGHQLNHVVACLLDAVQVVIGEVTVA